MTAIGKHHTRTSTTTDSWITPLYLIDALGPFDLDPCESIPQPWPCATNSFNERHDGLLQSWRGRVWLNPPYGRAATTWLRRLSHHGNGIALLFARTETKMFFDHVWGKANAVLFIKGRLTFFRPDGSNPRDEGGGNSGGPSILIAYGDRNMESLRKNRNLGKFIVLRGSQASACNDSL